MPRTTVDYGIDLGTTNSCIALLKGTQVEVIRNSEEREYTPSAVWLDRRRRMHVGRKAKEQYEADPENGCLEFKLQMGKSFEKVFARSGERMKPEEMSGEVLKSLLSDARTRYSEEVQAAVICVPADFNLPENEATRKAAQLAGLTVSPLLLEPVAAALAYGFQSDSEKVLWLVYDLGGGTFDAALMQMRDGEIRVVNHDGDKHLGGKLIDWEIVDQILAPAVAREYRLSDFRRGVAKWNAAMAKLKLKAEEAKILVSRSQSAPIEIEFGDESGQLIQFDYELQRGEVECLIEPFVVRSINICKKVLEEKRLGGGDVEKVLLVGGPTFTPYLRQRLADPREGLGIRLDFSQDPMTVVARGAAVFGGTQRLELADLPPVAAGELGLELEYQPIGADTNPLVGGRIVPQPNQSFAGFTVEFVDCEARPPWRSGKLRVGAKGAFATSLKAEKGRRNTYLIELHDVNGRKRPTMPNQITYTIGAVATDAPLTHSVGVAMANNEIDVFIHKGTGLPARGKRVHKTAIAVRRGQSGELIRIPVVEGENARADRNRCTGKIEIAASKLKRDLPAGSEVEIYIEIDPSRQIKTRAFIPLLDEEYEQVVSLKEKTPDQEELSKYSERETKRLKDAREKARNLGDPQALRALGRIDGEHMEHDVNAALDAAHADPDAADKCQQRLIDLRAAIDEVENSLRWPALVKEAEEHIGRMNSIVKEHGSTSDHQRASLLESETREAMKTHDADLLQRKVNEMSTLIVNVLQERPEFWVAVLGNIVDQRANMRDPGLADQLINQANRAIHNNDIPGLKAAIRQLVGLLPTDQQQKISGAYGGSTIR